MEREALQVQTKLTSGKASILYLVAAIAIWAAVLYGLVTPTPAHRPVRMVVAVAPCRP